MGKNNDISCVGLLATSKTSAEIAAEKADRDAADKAAAARRRKNLTVQVVLGITLPIIAIGIAAAAWWRRQKILNDRDIGIWDGQDVNVRSYHDQPPVEAANRTNQMGEVGLFESASLPDSKLSRYRMSQNQSDLPLLQDEPLSAIPQAGSSFSTSSPSYSSSAGLLPHPRTSDPSNMHPKALEARNRQHGNTSLQSSSSQSFPNTPQPNNRVLPSGALPPLTPGLSPDRMGVVPLDPDVQPDIIIQHRDGGGSGVVQELPPPYVDPDQRRQLDPLRIPR